MKAILVWVALAVAGAAQADAVVDRAVANYQFSLSQLVHKTVMLRRKGESAAATEKFERSQEYMDFCSSYRVVVLAYRLARDADNYQAWQVRKEDLDGDAKGGKISDSFFLSVYCR